MSRRDQLFTGFAYSGHRMAPVPVPSADPSPDLSTGEQSLMVITDSELLGQTSSSLVSIDSLSPLGRGNHAIVYHVALDGMSGYYVLKRSKKKLRHRQLPVSAQLAKTVTAGLSRPTDRHVIVSIQTYIDTNGHLCEVQAFMPHHLDKLINQLAQKRHHFPDEQLMPAICVYLRDILDGLAFIHEQGCIHADLKTENIALFEGHAIVIDLGSIKPINNTCQNTSDGTPYYTPPACAAGFICAQPERDIFAAGMILDEFIHRLCRSDLESSLSQSQSLGDLMKSQCEAFEEALRETSNPPEPLATALAKKVTLKEKLQLIADRMRAIIPAHQPSMSELIGIVDGLIAVNCTRGADAYRLSDEAVEQLMTPVREPTPDERKESHPSMVPQPEPARTSSTLTLESLNSHHSSASGDSLGHASPDALPKLPEQVTSRDCIEVKTPKKDAMPPSPKSPVLPGVNAQAGQGAPQAESKTHYRKYTESWLARGTATKLVSSRRSLEPKVWRRIVRPSFNEDGKPAGLIPQPPQEPPTGDEKRYPGVRFSM